jgi:hypothetical protein
MNERIKELARQVGAKPIYYEYLTGYEIPGKNGLEEFAQSIIKDCLIIMTSEEYNMTMLTCNPMVSGAINDAKWKIKEHFGEK